MITEALLGGLLVGFLGSFHCVGMCGPLALSLPVSQLPKWQRAGSVFLYNTGRIFTYAMLGLIIGFAGQNIKLSGFQNTFSIISGIILVLIALQLFLQKSGQTPVFLRKFQGRVMDLMNYALQKKSLSGFLLLGMANGLLPCGMVYLAIAGAVNTGNVVAGIAFMTMFGLGTFPAMMVLSLAGYRVSLSVRNRIKTLVPYVVSVMGILLILRGMNLGIPYISPQLIRAGSSAEPVLCH